MKWLELALWGLVGTLCLTSILAIAQGLRWTRMSLPLMLGTTISPDWDRATTEGFGIHLVFGWVFALLYAGLFASLERASWWMGALIGLAHGTVVLTVLLPLLPAVHPRMASEHRKPEPTPLLEPPGFMALNYGRSTPVVTLVGHAVFGAVLGAGWRGR